MAGVILAPEVFAPEHIPSAIEGRKLQEEEIMCCLAPAAKGHRPMHVWLYGKTGTGKTVTVKSAVFRHGTASNVRHVYVNCIRDRTAYAILEFILTELRVLMAETQQVGYKARRLAEAISGRPLVVVIDESDRMPVDEREHILHLLSEIEGIGLICISEEKEAFAELNIKTANRINPVFIEMPAYSNAEIISILSDRAAGGLVKGSWSQNLLEKIALKANGDARVAIQTLRGAAYCADCEMAGFIEARHAEEGFMKAQSIRRDYKLRRLSLHHRCIYEIVMEKKTVSLYTVADEYRNRCKKQGIEPVSKRSFYRYTETLRRMRLIRGEKVRSFGSHTKLEMVE